MPLPPELLSAVDDTRDLRAEIQDEQHSRFDEETEHVNDENEEIQSVVEWGRAVAEAAVEENVPINIYTTDTTYARERRLPFVTPSRKETTEPHEVDRHTVSPHYTTRDNGARTPFIRRRSLRLKRGRTAEGPRESEGWLLNTTKYGSRTIGVMLTTEGQIELFDVPGKLSTQEDETDAAYKDVSSGHFMGKVLLDRSVYMRSVYEQVLLGKHNHTLFLSELSHPLPAIIDKVADSSTDEHLNGLEAIEQGLVNFVIENLPLPERTPSAGLHLVSSDPVIPRSVLRRRAAQGESFEERAEKIAKDPSWEELFDPTRLHRLHRRIQDEVGPQYRDALEEINRQREADGEEPLINLPQVIKSSIVRPVSDRLTYEYSGYDDTPEEVIQAITILRLKHEGELKLKEKSDSPDTEDS
ncbi:MAG TPA: hypothetical protein VLG13_00725 [Patescibacteria group bacterium]|nr:hypothetical protein [Patescibacteria group bacterium]